MGAFVDITGERFGRLKIMYRAKNIGKITAWLCLCDCGTEKIVQGGHLKLGRIVSCGGYKRENSTIKATRHGDWGSKLHKIWLTMRQRCNNPKCKAYINYGGRSLKILPVWDEYTTFQKWALGHNYKEGLSIERVNNNGNYCPENCKWIPRCEQNKNTRRTLNNKVGGNR